MIPPLVCGHAELMFKGIGLLSAPLRTRILKNHICKVNTYPVTLVFNNCLFFCFLAQGWEVTVATVATAVKVMVVQASIVAILSI